MNNEHHSILHTEMQKFHAQQQISDTGAKINKNYYTSYSGINHQISPT